MKMIITLVIWITFTQQNAMAKTLSFGDALNMINGNSSNLINAKNEQEFSKLQLFQSKVNFLPNFALTSSASKYHQIVGTGGDFESNIFTYGMSSSVNLFRFGADIYQFKMAEKNLMGQEANSKLTHLKEEAKISELYFLTLALKQENAVLTKIHEIKQKGYEIAKARFHKGLTPLQEVEKIKIDVDISETKLRDLEFQLNRQIVELLTALKFENENIELDQHWPLMSFVDDAQFNKITQNNGNSEIVSHPGIAKFQNLYQASIYQSKSSYKSLFPRLDVTYRYNFEKTRTVSPYQREQSITLLLTIPVFDHLRDYSQFQYNRVVEERNRLNYEDGIRELKSQQALTLQQMKLEHQSTKSRLETVKLARKLYRDNFSRFEQGRSSVNDLLIDQERLYNAEILSIKGLTQLHQSILRYCHSQGTPLQQCVKL